MRSRDTRTDEIKALFRGKGLAGDVSYSGYRETYHLYARPDDFLRVLETFPKAKAAKWEVEYARKRVAEGQQSKQSYSFELRMPA